MTRAVEATGRTLDEALASREDALVLFYGSNCEPSVGFLPEFLRAATRADVPFVLVDVDDEGDAAVDLFARYGLSITPTLARFRNGREVARREGREHAGLSGVDLQAIVEGVERAPH